MSDFERRADWLRAEVAQGQTGAARHHPDLEEMAAYAERALDEGRQEEIREHLVSCGSCARLALDLTEVASLSAPQVTESAARWESLHPRLVEEGLVRPKPAPALAAVGTEAARPAAPSPNGWRFRAIGLAMVLLVSLGYNIWQWKVANEPRLAQQAVTFFVTRSESEAQRITLDERSRRRDLVLRIKANTLDPLSGLRAELLTWPEKKLVWSDTLEGEAEDLTLAIPTSALDSREYRVVLWGRTAAGWKKVGTHGFRIAFAL